MVQCENIQSNEQNCESQLDESQMWTQNQQKALEWALTQYPKGTEDRWDKIAEQIAGKSKVSIREMSKFKGQGHNVTLKGFIIYLIYNIFVYPFMFLYF